MPYRYGSEKRTYIPDFIVHVDDGNEDPLHLVVEIKGYRQEDSKDKKNTMESYWVPGVNILGTHARDHLFVTSVDPASEFLDDLQTSII